MEEFVNENTRCLLLAIHNDCVGTARVGVAAVEIGGSGGGAVGGKLARGRVGEPDDPPRTSCLGSKSLEHPPPFLERDVSAGFNNRNHFAKFAPITDKCGRPCFELVHKILARAI
jgi:hypothetical protein